ncbi:dynein axonemal heavy chain 2-like [Clytia hemisphaerica]|uniref:Dynein axonemal heavy chain 2 n=1 Tax=Clytia hemisphaerica TaxID=252671 RepID=A0A7M5V9H0_9CNID
MASRPSSKSNLLTPNTPTRRKSSSKAGGRTPTKSKSNAKASPSRVASSRNTNKSSGKGKKNKQDSSASEKNEDVEVNVEEPPKDEPEQEEVVIPPPVEVEPEVNLEEVMELETISLIKRQVTLTGFNESMWKDDHSETILNFIRCIEENKRLLTFHIDADQQLVVSTEIPTAPVGQVFFIIRKKEVKITPNNFNQAVLFQLIRSNYVESLLRTMSSLYGPMFFQNKSWPESIKNDFINHVHKFMATLIDAKYKTQGKTVLYVPNEGRNLTVQQATRNKEYVQRLESCMIHWIRQIKEVLNSQDAYETSENAGPLEEIEFWKSRCEDLSGISDQLSKAGVKQIQETLQQSKSSYVGPFKKLAKLIQDGFNQAQSNLKFLSLLQQPCEELVESGPEKIPKLLPKLLNLIRFIWTNSDHYKGRDRITGLLRKVSNEVIRRCSTRINLDDIFNGNVKASIDGLQQSIQCCISWKSIYMDISKVHLWYSESDEKWVLDQTSIFAQADAFVQRCKDLLEVCEGLIHFARRTDGTHHTLPIFSGLKGPDIARSLNEVESTFMKNLVILKNVKHTILDVKATTWHDDYNRFRSSVKDLEVMIQNILNSAFETIKTVQEGAEILSHFVHLNSRESIRRTIDKKTVEVYNIFLEELNAVKKEFNNHKPLIPFLHPDYAGVAVWARSLKKRIDKPHNVLKNAKALPMVGLGEEIKQQYQQLAQALDEYVRKTFNEWTTTVDKDTNKLLDVPLMCRSSSQLGMLELNFDRSLLKLFQEISYWEKLMFEIPHYAADVHAKREELRILRENVLLVIRDYNRIIAILTPEERALFKERIRFLDKKIHPGLTKLSWASKGISEYYVNECRLNSNKVQTVVDDFKTSIVDIMKKCRSISEALLIKIDPKRVYDDLDFDEEQRVHRKAVQTRLQSIHESIVVLMRRIYEVFKNDSHEIQNQWIRFTDKIDRMVEEALRLNAKWSLQELSRAINGDGKNTPNPLFRIKVVLEGTQEFSPKLKAIAHVINTIGKDLTTSLTVLPRLLDVLTPIKCKKKPYHVIVGNDDETKKIQSHLATGMSQNSTLLLQYLTTWDSYREIWELDKEAFIRRYQRLNPPVSSFDADISRYTEVANNVQKVETIVNIQFVLLDSSPLKFSILSHCNEWQNGFTRVLKEMAISKLTDLHTFMEGNSKTLRTAPGNLEHLSTSIQLLEDLQADLTNTEAKIPPLHEQFVILEKYEVEISEEVQEQLQTLGPAWIAFQQCLIDCDDMLRKSKEKFKAGLLSSSEEFKKAVSNLEDEFALRGPISPKIAVNEALAAIKAFNNQVDSLKEQEAKIRRGLNIFKIEQQPSKALKSVEKDIGLLQQIWLITEEWEGLWSKWKYGKFADLVTTDLETTSQVLLKRIHKLNREVKDKNWEISEAIKSRIDQFKRTMPLIQDLKNEAMRERHWSEIKSSIQKAFDHESNAFTLEQIIGLGLDQFAEQISEISAAASKELSIEQVLKEIAEVWKTLNLDIAPYKDRGHHKLKATDEIFQYLEDNQVTLSTMKASRYVKPFEVEVDRWERTLSLIMEVIEMILTVQRQWMYLENIFLGEDIRKQLPRESAEFDDVNSNWKIIMNRLNKDSNALRGSQYPNMLETLNEMNIKLEEIQKSLDMYLETKRQIFPRFYFLSNDDLLEILGQSKNPEAVQSHLKKCFDNIKSLKISKVSGLSQKVEAIGMFSSDGEYVEFGHSVILEGPVESWLCDVERSMRWTLKELLKLCRTALKKVGTKREKWVKEWAGQLLITSSQIQWTSDCTKALSSTKDKQDKKPLKGLRKKQISMLGKFSEMIRGNLTKIQRLKLVALITIEVHARDVIEKMIKSGCSDINAFEWLSQLRLYWDKGVDDCIVRQTNTQFQYGYEYLGNSGRLVITPLTDRCYMTLTTALHLHRGGSPKGPAGTGKTETVKDLGKALGAYVIVVNCSEGLDFKSMGRMFSGLAQTGAWGCFDEFNRINIEVLSVVAQQILSILTALSVGSERFVFEGREISLIWSCGIFITMNPGYAGRTELPDNLKSMFRPISMVVPDSAMIAEIILFAEGFNNTKVLAKKVHTLYSLAVQQLSKQDHYDFGLRGLTSLLRYAGKKKRANPTFTDEEVLLLSMKDMNVAKLTSQDLLLFNGIMSDLFPGVDTPINDYGKLKAVICGELKENGYQCHPVTIQKVIQLYETKNSRHSTMIVGKTGPGKSVVWRTLQSTLSTMKRNGEPGFNTVKEYPINPKAVSLGELYGEFDLATNEWSDGVLSSVMRQTCSDEKPEEKWIIFDGPVDTLWIESMNSVMDDNKILTLINGERISMPEQVSLLFECEDLSVASPATVSRCGMVYMDYNDIGWRPYVDSWLEKRNDKDTEEHLVRLFDKYVQSLLDFKRVNCTDMVAIAELNGIESLCVLLGALLTEENGISAMDVDNFPRMIELWFLFCLIWSICASVDEDSRRKIDNFLRELEGSFPSKDTVYEYHVDVKQKTWVSWEDKLRTGWRYSPTIPFYKIMVPTVDSVRYNFLLDTLIKVKRPVLMTGPVGTGKTSVAQKVLENLDNKVWNVLTINMSAQTSSNNVQEIIESKVEKRTKGVYVPIGGKQMLTFMDDLNMPAKDTFGSQPPLELIRQWIDYGFWFDRQKQSMKFIKDMLLVAAMGPPGGGRTHISERLKSRFNLINMTFPQDSQIKRIFGTMITQKLQEFEEEVKATGDILTQATIDIYTSIVQTMLPTPTKIHYLFNLRDISKVFQGLLRANKDYHDTKSSIARLWVHECFRVFADRLIDDNDREVFVNLLSDKLGTMMDFSYHNLCPNKVPPIFGDFVRGNGVYEDIVDFKALKTFMEERLEDFNMEPGVIAMDLVLFRDAIEHVCRVIRVIGQPRGNMLLVGIGGSGRQSLAKLASYTLEYKVFMIEVTKHYRRQEFHEDLRKLYHQAGVENKPTVFLFSDTQVLDESFLEDINNILSSGEVPNLYKPEDFEEVKSVIIDRARKEGIIETNESLFKYFIDSVRANLHVVLCMSPVGDPFRNRIRQYPAFVNCTTIDWFSEWPHDALLEVAGKYLEDMNIGDETVKSNVSQVFATIHQSVVQVSEKMLFEMKRHNYVTPTNYLELVTGYKMLMSEKSKELGDAANKLKNGLEKIDDTRQKVEVMSVELEEAKVQVAAFQKQCEEFLVVIVQQKREADEQQKSVATRSEKIAEEEVKCRAIADSAQLELDEALPALQDAIKALESLNKKDMTEIKSYSIPPPLVQKVMEAVMLLKGHEPTWAEAKRQLGDTNFIEKLINFDRDNITDRVLKKIGTYCSQADFVPDIVGRVSGAAKSLCMWVRAMEVYGRIFRVVEPKKQRLANATALLNEKQRTLSEAKEKLKEVTDKIESLKKNYDEKLAQKEELGNRANMLELKLERAGKLVSGLGGERERWEASVGVFEQNIEYLVGDCLVAAAFLSYAGPFLSSYRDELVDKTWLAEIKKLQVSCNPEFSFSGFMAKPTQVREWNIQGLPSDSFSTENGCIVQRGSRWPLMVDPQGQAIKWIKNMETKRGLKIIDLQQSDYLRTLENAIQFGSPVLLQNVFEELDPSLAPVLNRSIVKQGGRLLIKLGDKEVEYNPEFKFYICTKLSNPHYTPEISTKTTIVNFAVKEQGLEAQLLGIVVRKERPELEEQKDSLVINIAAGKKKLEELEDEILRLLSTAQGSLLDDEQLVNTLHTSKITSTEVSEQLETSEQTEIKIDTAREGYRPCAERASILFFVLNDLGRIDPMYQFSLDSYIELFNNSIDKSKRSQKLEERIQNLNDFHTYAVYRYTCRGLFEKHKLLFSFQMCTKIMEASGKINMDEYNFFLRGGVVLDREEQMDNPCSNWLSDAAWDNVTELDKLTNFHGMIASFEQYPRDWNVWFTSGEPEIASLPGEWENACNELQRMLVVRSLRPDRVSFCANSFIINNLGSKFVEPPVLDMRSVLEDSTTRTPLIFVLSTGVDPTSALLQLAESCNMNNRFHALSLGQGQAPIATRMIKEGVREGNWVFLANCHLSLSWMPQLDKLVEQLQVEKPHPDFRIWLSSSPHPDFPISILQAGIKMTTEPPKGLKANMKRLYQLITDQQFSRCKEQEKYKKLLFSLCFFHSVLLERKKFLQLGWNIPYGFNDSDFEVSENLLSIYLDEYEDTPWDALKYLIAGVNYGGHVTDDWDRRLLMTYVNDAFNDNVLSEPFYQLSANSNYYVPKSGSIGSYRDFISMLPNIDKPDAFGQNPNADIASQIRETRSLFDTLLSLQPQVSSAGQGERPEDKVMDLAADVLRKVPDLIDYDQTAKIMAEDPCPLNVVLLQEITRYNALLTTIKTSLTELQRGIKGLVVMSTELEETFHCIFDGRVPPIWEKAYPSLKPLASWTRDLVQRVEHFDKWATTAHPPVIFWMSAFTFPTGFLTAVLQTCARQNNISVDSLSWEFVVSTVDDTHLQAPKDGVYIRGLFLEGAGWDKRNAYLIEAEPMQLVCPIPTIHFKPVENKKKSGKGMYACPCYYYSNRTGGSGRPSFVVAVDLKSGAVTPDYWVKRGTALLMSLDD